MKTEWLSDCMSFPKFIFCIMILLMTAGGGFVGNTACGKEPETVWRISLDPQGFQSVDQQAKEGALDSRVIGVVSNRKAIEQAGFSDVRPCGEGAAFEVVGSVPDRKTMKWMRSAASEKNASFQYYLLRYKAKGICRDAANFAVISLSGKDPSGKAVSKTLMDCSQVINDDQWHVVIGKKTIDFTAEAVEVEVSTIDSAASFALDSLVFSDRLPQSPLPSDCRRDRDEGGLQDQFSLLNLESAFNDSSEASAARVLDKYGVITDNFNFFFAEHLTAGGIPFKLKTEGANLIHSADDASVNQQQVDFMGHQVMRKYFFPVSRDDSISIAIGKKACEAFLILSAECPPATGRYGLPDEPFFIDDSEMFSIELVYEDGQSDIAFPYSIADQGYIIRRSIGFYAVAVDETRMLQSMIFHNRFFGATVNVAAVTLNASSARRFAELVQEPPMMRVPLLPEPPFRPVYMDHDDSKIRCGNSYFDLVINCQNGLSIEKCVSRWSTAVEQVLEASSGLAVAVGQHQLTGSDFSVEQVEMKDNAAAIELKSRVDAVPLTLTVHVAVNETPQMLLRLSAKNTSDKPISPQIQFPVLNHIRIGTLEDTWMCFPQYRNVISNQEGFHLAANDHAFPMQFYDIYNPCIGMGLAVITHNLTHCPMDYSLRKTSQGVSAFVQYPKEFYPLQAGQEIQFPETAIVCHRGDWRNAAQAYRRWVDTWYRSHRSADRAWFQSISFLKDYFLPETVSLRDLKVPSMYDRKTGQFRIKEYLETDKKYWGGLSPDMIHFFHWSYLDADQEGSKDYGQYTYDHLGGLDTFKSAIGTLQQEYKTPVSLYMVPDRCSTGTETGRRLGEKAVKLRVDGSQLANATTWYVCAEQKDWLEDFVQNAVMIQRDTGADVIYLDVVGFWRTNTCYSPEHGHCVPNWYNQATYALMKKMREALPDHVAIWSEYPMTDVNTQFTDGNITYYYLTLYELWTKSHDTLEQANRYSNPSLNVYRFLFPDVKQIALPIGNESAVNGPNQLKFTFFNGDGIYDNGWLSMASRPRETLMIKSTAIKKKFSDCFYSADITPLVDTERAHVYANRFAGKDKTVWTLYNGRYTTVRGAVLAVEHRPGATYYDAWNEKTLSPQVVDGRAIISQKLDPQAVGCIVQYRTEE